MSLIIYGHLFWGNILKDTFRGARLIYNHFKLLNKFKRRNLRTWPMGHLFVVDSLTEKGA